MNVPAVKIPADPDGEEKVAPDGVLDGNREQGLGCLVPPGEQEPSEKGENRRHPIAVEKVRDSKTESIQHDEPSGVAIEEVTVAMEEETTKQQFLGQHQ